MAEAFAVVGLISVIIQLVDFGSKIVHRLDELRSDIDQIPQVFRDIKNQLPLLLNTLQRTRAQAEAGDFDADTQRAILSVVEGCQSQVQSLDDVLNKTLPSMGDSRWRRGMKVLLNVRQEKGVQRIIESLQTYVSTLTYHQATGLFNGQPKPTTPLFTVPSDRDPDFVGRSDILEEIGQRLKSHDRVALAGIGGVGKSQIAVEFCYRFKEAYPESWVLWIHASTVTRFDEAYKEIARKARLPGWQNPKVNTLQLVLEWLSGDGIDRWLLVLDNADDEEVFFNTKSYQSSETVAGKKILADYIPRRSNGSIIITTRDQRVGGRLAVRAKPIAVLPLTLQVAENLLCSRIWGEDVSNEVNIKSLLHALGYLPLAITQAAAFIRENSTTVSEYLDMLLASDGDMKDLLSEELEDSRRDSDTRNSVIRTWKLSFDQIRNRNPRAAEILSLMSVVDRQGIPKSLLRKDNDRPVEFTTALGTLQAFSLITAERTGDSFEMHRLVQLATQRWLELEGTMVQWQQEAIRLLSNVFPQGTFENWPTCNRLIPHVQIAILYSFGPQSCQLHRATLLNNLSVYDRTQGRYRMALYTGSEALAAREKLQGAEHPDTLTSVSNLALVLQNQGKYEKAEEMNRRALTGREKLLGLEHPDTLISISNLAMVLRDQGKYKAAEKRHQQVLEGREKVLGAEHPDTLTSVNNLAGVLRKQGKYTEGERIYRRALEGREKVLGAEHPDTLTSVNNLASVLRYQGKHEEAEKMHQRALKGREKILGMEHPDTLISVDCLARVFQKQGKYASAEEMHRRVLKGREKELGINHPSTLSSVSNLAGVLQNQGKYEDAEKAHRRALDGYEKALGLEHPDTLISISNLAMVLRDQGKYKAAEKRHQQVLEGREKVLGAEHPDTLTSVNNLAGVLRKQGKYTEGERIYRRALEGREKVLGAEHPDTLTSVNNLASVLRYQEKYEEAEKMHQRALKGREKILGIEHLDTLISVDNLARVFQKQGKYASAEEMHRRVLKGREKELGINHPSTLSSVSNLAGVLQNQGKYEDAEKAHRRALDGYEKALGLEHPDTLTSVDNLATVFRDQRQYEDAAKMHRRALEGREKVLGKEHPSTLASVNNLALVVRINETTTTL